jgi:hypothetical protein
MRPNAAPGFCLSRDGPLTLQVTNQVGASRGGGTNNAVAVGTQQRTKPTARTDLTLR